MQQVENKPNLPDATSALLEPINNLTREVKALREEFSTKTKQATDDFWTRAEVAANNSLKTPSMILGVCMIAAAFVLALVLRQSRKAV